MHPVQLWLLQSTFFFLEIDVYTKNPNVDVQVLFVFSEKIVKTCYFYKIKAMAIF